MESIQWGSTPSLACKYDTRVKVAGNGEHASLQQFGVSYTNLFYIRGQWRVRLLFALIF